MRCSALRSRGPQMGSVQDPASPQDTRTSRLVRPASFLTCLLVAASIGTAARAQSPAVTASASAVNAGSWKVGQTSSVRTVTFTFHADEVVDAVNVLTEGLPGGAFVAAGSSTCKATSYHAGNTCTVSFQFTPRTVGLVRGAITLTTGNEALPASPLITTYIHGVGRGGVLALSGNITTLLGTLPAGYTLQHAITDAAGNLYAVEQNQGTPGLAEYTASGNFRFSPLASLTAFTDGCCGVAMDGAGNFYIGSMRTLPGGGFTNLAPDLTRVADVLVDGAGNAFILETSGTPGQHASVTRVAPDGRETLLANLPDGAMYEAMDPGGNLYVSCQSEMVKVTPDGTVTRLFAIPYASPFAIDAAGIFYFSLADVSGVKFTVPHSTVTGHLVAIDAKGGILYTEPGGPNGALRLVRLNRDRATVNFPNTAPGDTSKPMATNFRNIGNEKVIPLNGGGEITGAGAADFFMSDSTCSLSGLPSAQTCTAYFEFQPSAAGARAATANVESTASGAPQTISLSGVGESPAPVASLSVNHLDFGNYTCVGQDSQSGQYVTLTNTGTSPLTLTRNPQITGANANSFLLLGGNPQICSAGTSLAPQQSCYLTAYEYPQTSGNLTASINLWDNAPGSPQKVTLSGFGNNTSYLSFSNTSLLLRSPALHVQSTEVLQIINQECGNVQFTGMTITGPNASDFSILSTTCPTTPSLGPQAACTIVFGYTPSTTDVESATFTLTDNSSGSQSQFAMHGLYSPSN
jgi:hypothetical protein